MYIVLHIVHQILQLFPFDKTDQQTKINKYKQGPKSTCTIPSSWNDDMLMKDRHGKRDVYAYQSHPFTFSGEGLKPIETKLSLDPPDS